MENSFGKGPEKKEEGKLLNKVKKVLHVGAIVGAGALSQGPAAAQEYEQQGWEDKDAQYSVVHDPQHTGSSYQDVSFNASNHSYVAAGTSYNGNFVDTGYRGREPDSLETHEGKKNEEVKEPFQDTFIPPQIAKMEEERRQAVEMMLTLLDEKIRDLGEPTSLDAYGKKFDLRKNNIPDALVAQAQQLHAVTLDLLPTVRGVNYRNEEALLLIETVIDGYEKFVTAYAAFLEKNKKSAEMLNRILPATGAVLNEQLSINKK